jgi:hypothetical protein
MRQKSELVRIEGINSATNNAIKTPALVIPNLILAIKISLLYLNVKHQKQERLCKWLAINISYVAHGNHDEVNERPNAAATKREQLANTQTCLTKVETVNTKTTQEKTE